MTSNTTPKHGRKFRVARAAAIVGVLAGLGFGGLSIARSQSQSAAATVETELTVVETTTAALGTLTTTLDTVGNLEPIQTTTLTFATSAPVTSVAVSEGSHVEAGSVLATLDTADGEARVRSAQMSVAQQQLSLNEVLAPATDLELESAQLSVDSAQASLYSSSSSSSTSANDAEIARLETELAANSLWQAQMNRDQQLEQAAARAGGEVDYGTELQANQSVNSAERSLELSELEYDDTVNGDDSSNYSQIASGQASLASAEADLAELQAGATEQSIRLAEISLEQAQLDLESAQRGLEDYALVAPFSGIVAEQTLVAGTLPASGSITLIDTSTFTMDVSIAEADIASVSLGQHVTLSVQALPSAELNGTITHIDLVPGSSGGLVTYGATITLDPAPETALRPGMSATAAIILEQLDDVLLLPTRFLQTNEITGATTVMVQSADGTITEVTVTTGSRGASETEITSGLSAGQTVVIVADAASADQAAGGLGLGLFGGGGQMRMNSGQMPSGGPPSGSGGGAPPSGG